MSATVDDERHVEGEEQTELKRANGPRLLLLFIVANGGHLSDEDLDF